MFLINGEKNLGGCKKFFEKFALKIFFFQKNHIQNFEFFSFKFFQKWLYILMSNMNVEFHKFSFDAYFVKMSQKLWNIRIFLSKSWKLMKITFFSFLTKFFKINDGFQSFYQCIKIPSFICDHFWVIWRSNRALK